MTGISFTPTFQHTDWVDNRDRVQAAGQNGFNNRFNAVEADLKNLSAVVGTIDQAITALSAHPTTAPKTISLSPLLTPALPSAASPQPSPAGWSIDSTTGIAQKPPGLSGSFAGVMNVVLPGGAVVQSLRITATNSSTVARFSVSLNRIPLVVTSSTVPDTLVRSVISTSPFDVTANTSAAFSQVDVSHFRYYLVAGVDSAVAADVITLGGFQITYAG
ncbi:hypothetical protein [Streptomyces sp. NRRL S-350]|uniref:hypothetical protein n=1 Tax=Streptomyces sp. NRRL S-350 TaxID=1463902 RepID=UPI0004C0B345|nr:hypothetical protein [Streptomyces sp. NRRL S-350]